MGQSKTADIGILIAELAMRGIEEPVKEHLFHPTRRWKFDLAWPRVKVAFEREGFAPGGAPGRHQRPAGFRGDAEKYNEAALLGWLLIRATGRMITDGIAAQHIVRAMAIRDGGSKR